MRKTENKLQQLYPKDCNLLIAQDLWQAHCQILLKILLKEFIKVNVITDTMMENYETCGIKYKDYDCFLEYTNIKDDLKGYKCLCYNNYQKEFDVNSY